MIKLKLDPWCTHCMVFEPVKDAPEVSFVEDSHGNIIKKYSRETIYVKCMYAPACYEAYTKFDEVKKCLKRDIEKSQSSSKQSSGQETTSMNSPN